MLSFFFSCYSCVCAERRRNDSIQHTKVHFYAFLIASYMFAFSIFSFILFLHSFCSFVCVGIGIGSETLQMLCGSESFVCLTWTTHFISIRSVCATGSFFFCKCVYFSSFDDLVRFQANEIFHFNTIQCPVGFCLYIALVELSLHFRNACGSDDDRENHEYLIGMNELVLNIAFTSNIVWIVAKIAER